MLVGCMLWRIGDDILDLHDQIRWTADRGFQAVGFWTCAGQEGMWQGFDVATASARDIARLVSALAPFESVDLHAHRSLPVVGGDERVGAMADLQSGVRFAGEIGAQTVTMHLDDESAVSDDTRSALLPALDALNEWAADSGVRLGLELTSHYDLGLTLDVGHVHFRGGEGYRAFGSVAGLIDAISRRLYHVHGHDYDGVLDHLAIGDGMIEWAGVVSALSLAGYDGVLSLELNADRASAEALLRSRGLLMDWIVAGGGQRS